MLTSTNRPRSSLLFPAHTPMLALSHTRTSTVETSFRWDRAECLKERAFVVQSMHSGESMDLGFNSTSDELGASNLVPAVDFGGAELADALPIFADEVKARHFITLPFQGFHAALKWLKKETAKHHSPLTGCFFNAHRAVREIGGGTLVCGSAGFVLRGVSDDSATSLEKSFMDNICGEALAAWASCRIRQAAAGIEGLATLGSLATTPLLFLRSSMPDVIAPLAPPSDRTFVAPLPSNDFQLVVFDVGNAHVARAWGVTVALKIKEGLDALRNCAGYRSSYLVWFVGGDPPFQLGHAVTEAHL